MPFDPPLRCPWRCHEIGGPWVSFNPSCPFDGNDRVDLETLSQEAGERMCQEEVDRREEAELASQADSE